MTIFNGGLLQSLLPHLKARNEGVTFITQEILTGSVTSITISSIPDRYTHLLFIGGLRTDRAAENDTVGVRFNSDTGNNYDTEVFTVTHSSASGSATLATGAPLLFVAEAANSRASNFSPCFAYIPNYKSTSLEKFAQAFSSAMGDVSAQTDVLETYRTMRWRNTAAITTITLLPNGGTNFVTDSRVALYGIR